MSRRRVDHYHHNSGCGLGCLPYIIWAVIILTVIGYISGGG